MVVTFADSRLSDVRERLAPRLPHAPEITRETRRKQSRPRLRPHASAKMTGKYARQCEFNAWRTVKVPLYDMTYRSMLLFQFTKWFTRPSSQNDRGPRVAFPLHASKPLPPYGAAATCGGALQWCGAAVLRPNHHYIYALAGPIFSPPFHLTCPDYYNFVPHTSSPKKTIYYWTSVMGTPTSVIMTGIS